MAQSRVNLNLPEEEPANISPADAEKMREVGSFFSDGEISLTLVIITFGLISLVIYYLIIRNQKYDDFTLRVYVILILIIGTLLVVSSSYGTTQTAPIVGFFGTVAGYLLGKSEKNRDSE